MDTYYGEVLYKHFSNRTTRWADLKPEEREEWAWRARLLLKPTDDLRERARVAAEEVTGSAASSASVADAVLLAVLPRGEE